MNIFKNKKICILNFLLILFTHNSAEAGAPEFSQLLNSQVSAEAKTAVCSTVLDKKAALSEKLLDDNLKTKLNIDEALTPFIDNRTRAVFAHNIVKLKELEALVEEGYIATKDMDLTDNKLHEKLIKDCEDSVESLMKLKEYKKELIATVEEGVPYVLMKTYKKK